MKFPIPRAYPYIRDVDKVLYGTSKNKEGLIVPELTFKYGSFLSKIKTMPFYAKYLFGCLSEIKKSVQSITTNPYNRTIHISLEDMSELKAYAKELGVSDIGYTTVETQHLFKESIVLFKKAIVFTMEMKKEEISKAPSIPTIKEIFRTYYGLGLAVNKISDFLRNKGYNAQGITAISSNINLTVLAKDAGLGGFGKSGLLITKAFGPSVRIAAVLTDIENLPTSATDDYQWIKEFCENCNRCVRKCPAQAIYMAPEVFEDGSEKHIDYKKCAVPFSKNNGCTICIKECLFFKASYNKIKERI
jgi:ferredoxin